MNILNTHLKNVLTLYGFYEIIKTFVIFDACFMESLLDAACFIC